MPVGVAILEAQKPQLMVILELNVVKSVIINQIVERTTFTKIIAR